MIHNGIQHPNLKDGLGRARKMGLCVFQLTLTWFTANPMTIPLIAKSREDALNLAEREMERLGATEALLEPTITLKE